MDKKDYKNVFVFAEQREGVIQPVALELLGKARDLADALGEKVVAMLLGEGIMEAYDKEVEVWSADKIDVEEGKLGLAGSPTKVFKSFPKAMKAPGEVHEVTPEEAVELIVNQLKVKHII